MSAKRILFIAPAQTVTCIFPQLKEAGFEIGIAENVKGASAFIRKGVPSLIFSRAFLPGYRAEDLLLVGADDSHFPPVIVFADKASPEDITRFLELGAKDFWLEPLSFEKIQAVVPQDSQKGYETSSSSSGSKAKEPEDFRIVGADSSMKRVLALAKQVANSKATVLISGESGTGKEMFSRYLHFHSDRRDKPFIAVNCAALPEHLLESELFGHEKGSFTGAIARKLGKFELASGGTLLLDEISEMDIGLQAKLLRVLQEGELDRVGGTETLKVDVRVLATSNRNLEAWVKEGKFRQDLYFRLNVIPLRLPSLHERGEDILVLAKFFAEHYTKEYKLAASAFSPEAIQWLMEYQWPGNVRELQNLMERAVLLSNGKTIYPQHFLLEEGEWPLFMEEEDEQSQTDEGLAKNSLSASTDSQPSHSATSSEYFSEGVIPLHEMERIMIQKGLEQTRGNRTQAAELLGISVRTLRNKLHEYRANGFLIEEDA